MEKIIYVNTYCFDLSCFFRYDTKSTERKEQKGNNKADYMKTCKICLWNDVKIHQSKNIWKLYM